MSRVTYAVLAAAALIAGPIAAANFNPGCPLPFKSIQAKNLAIESCGIEGSFKSAEDTPEHRAQNSAKNNFCATDDPPITLTFDDFANLQMAANNATPRSTLERATSCRLIRVRWSA